MSSLILPLETSEATLAIAGGKGANLSRLLQGGFPVPPGFLLTTAAYQAFVQAHNLSDEIQRLSQSAPVENPEALEQCSATIRQYFDTHPIPSDLASTIVEAYQALGPTPEQPLAVAVRSSATAEDLPSASFAGQQETYLNICGAEALLTAIKRCWSSLWTARAMAYRARQGIDPASVHLSVVVQQMVPAEVAGVLFTIHPVTGNQDEILINATWGLGEALVSGQVTPDTIVVGKQGGQVKSIEISAKTVMTAPTPEGTAELPVPEGQAQQAALTSEQAIELARIGRQIEAFFGGPQDIEWALADNRVFILQARPVTTLPSLDGPPVPGDDAWPAPGEDNTVHYFDLWTRADVGERWPDPVTPLTWSFTPDITNRNFQYTFRGLNAPYIQRIQWTRRFYGHVYINEGAMAHIIAQEYGMRADTSAAAMGSGLGPAQQGGYNVATILRRLPLFVALTFDRMRSERRFQALFPQIERWVADWMRQDLGPRTDQDLWTAYRSIWFPRAVEAINFHADITASAMVTLPSLEGMVARWGGTPELTHDLMGGLSGVITAEIVPALQGMARELTALGLAQVVLEHDPDTALAQLRANPAAQGWLRTLDAFLARHGHRCAVEAEFLHPRWAEAPEQILTMLGGYLRARTEQSIDPVAAEARQQRQRDAAIAQVEAGLNPLQRAFFRQMLARTQDLIRLRDNGQHYLVKLLLPVRHLFAELGRRWVARGWTSDPSDIFFLTLPELEAIIAAGSPSDLGMTLPPLVSARREAYEHWRQTQAPTTIGPDGTPIAIAPTDGASLQGIAASRGSVQGRARIILSPTEATDLQPGDILITRATDPGWTPIFPLVSGLVMEIGGQLSHGAIVAREYGIPAVINIPNATRLIAEGQMITIDGTQGLVYLAGVPAPEGE